jgi:hypothetical protein
MGTDRDACELVELGTRNTTSNLKHIGGRVRTTARDANGRFDERRLWVYNVSKVQLNAYDNVAIDSHAIQCAAKRISHDLEQCSYLASPVHCARWITKCAGDNEMTFHCFIDFLPFTIRMYIRMA